MERAIVIGASAAGLLAARMLARHARDVVVLERDALSLEGGPRRGIPQASHLHGLLTRGQRSLERYFPGIRDELVGRGAVLEDGNREVGWLGPYGFRPPLPGPGPSYLFATRSLLDDVLVRRVRSTPEIRVRGGCPVRGLVLDDRRRARGVRIESGEVIEGELVVDASGRGSSILRMLAAFDFDPPEETVVDAGYGYASALLRTKRPFPNGWRSLFVLGTTEVPRGAMLAEVENGLVVSTFVATGDSTLPTRPAEVPDFAASLRCDVVHAVVHDADFVSRLSTNRSTSSRRLRFGPMGLPDGLVPIGDALAVFNPVYGQGITVAGLEVEALDERLASEEDPTVAAKKALADFERIVDAVWSMTTAEDFRHRRTTGARPFGLRLVHAYLDRIHAASLRHPEVVRAFDRAANLEDFGGGLLEPRIAWRVLGTVPPPRPLERVERPSAFVAGAHP